MRTPDKSFSIHDTTVSIWRDSAAGDWETHEAIRMLMVRDGFTFHQCPETKKRYRCLAKNHHTGKKQDVHFAARLSGRHTEIVFYEDVIRDNRNGGQYHFDKLAKMPYQRRKKAQLAMGKIVRLLLSLGFIDTTKRVPESAYERCMIERRELEDFQGPQFYANGQASYDSTDADGNKLSDGQVRYFWDYSGRLGRGTVYHHINNMWWVIASPYTLRNIATFDFFEWRPGMPLKNPQDQLRKLEKRLASAVAEQDFERAAVLCDQLKAKRTVRVSAERKVA